MPNFGEGAINELTNEAGIELLKYKHFTENRISVIPENNINAINFFKKEGFENYSFEQRMYLGNKVEWNPKGIFSRAKAFIG